MNDATPMTLHPEPHGKRAFIPISRSDVLETVLNSELLPDQGDRALAQRVFHKIGCLRQHRSAEALNELSDAYDAFNPDDETLDQDVLSPEEGVAKRQELVAMLRKYTVSANYDELTERGLEDILSNASPDGVDVDVDFSEFDVKLIFFRGEGSVTREKRTLTSLFLKKKSYTFSTYLRLMMALKFKPEDVRIAEIMAGGKLDEAAARKKLAKLRRNLPKDAATDHVYLKIFKNIPRYDVEMLFPNIRVKMKYRDKVQLGGSALVGTLTWIVGTAAKLVVAVALSPVMLAVALVTGVGGILYAQIRNIFITRDRYRMQLAQSLYFQNLANNQGALALIVDEAEEEDIKEEVLLYSHMLGNTVAATELDALDRKIEAFLNAKFGVNVNFDFHDAFDRLVSYGIVSQSASGTYTAMPLAQADGHLRERWCSLVDTA